jgi:hypothetical protein
MCARAQAARSRQGKMEKSFLSFAATYPTWEPDSAAKQMLLSLGQGPPGAAGGAAGGGGGMPGSASRTGGPQDGLQSAVAASLFPGAPRCADHESGNYCSLLRADSILLLVSWRSDLLLYVCCCFPIFAAAHVDQAISCPVLLVPMSRAQLTWMPTVA